MTNPVNIYTHALVALAGKKRSMAFKLLSVLAGWIIFLGLVPAGLIWLTRPLNRLYAVPESGAVAAGIAIFSIPFGLFFLGWAACSQWRRGLGTPLYTAPTQKLVITGPYRYPIQLGAMCYYLGLGTWLGTLTQGIGCFLVSLALGSAYHHFIEERELARRFGQSYEAYQKSTPFLFPRFWHQSHASKSKG